MPLYEYACETDGTRLELLRPMADADKPVPDPENRGRVFKRVVASTFAAKGQGQGHTSASTSLPVGGGGACCPCGKSAGACGRS